MLKFGVGTTLFQKLDIREFLEQINDVRSVGGRVTEIISEQPYLIQRIRRLVRFALSNEFSSLANRERQNTGILDQIPQAFIDTSGISIRKHDASRELDTILAEPDTVPTVDATEEVMDNSVDPTYSLISLSKNETLPLRRRHTTIGRSVENDIVLTDDDRVSRNHAEITRQGGQLKLVDCGSRNGVWLNHQRLVEATLLKAGDRIRIGRQEFLFTVQED
jgi:pSer/pThr/pTyr-binding forkhead associated (FHA) protein